jgi:type IV pilus assembly protein PilA
MTRTNFLHFRRNRRPRPNGFTLMELLIVMAIIAILTLIAIPTIGNMTRSGNEVSAIQSVKAIFTAETQYSTTFPANGFSCSLPALGGDPHSGPPTATSAHMLDQGLATGVKSGYQFSITNCVKASENGGDRVTGYTIIAQPLTVGRTGNRTFCGDDGEIKVDPTGGTNCTQLLSQ